MATAWRQHGGLRAPTIASDGVARGGTALSCAGPPCVASMPGTVTTVPGTGSTRQPYMQGSANDQLSKHPGGGEQGEPWGEHLSVGGGGHLDLCGGRHHL